MNSHMHYQPPGSSAIFDPTTLRRQSFNRLSDVEQNAHRPSNGSKQAPTHQPSEKRQWGPSPMQAAKEQQQQQFKSANGRQTPMEELYQPSMSMRCDTEVANVMRPPSRAGSLCSTSVLYQPLTLTPLNAVWSNSMMFNRTPSDSSYGAAQPMAPIPRVTPPSEKQEPLKPNGILTNGSSKGSPPQQQKNVAYGNQMFIGPDNDSFNDHFNPKINSGFNHLVPPFPVRKPKARRSVGFMNAKAFSKISIIQILLGLLLLSLGVSRLVLMSTWGLGVELVYGVYVVFTGIFGVIGIHRSHYCSLMACCVMSSLSCILCIPPFITGLMVTVPYTTTKFHKLSADFFTSTTEPYSVDILLSVVCLLELIIAMITAGLGCQAVSKFINSGAKREDKADNNEDHSENSSAHLNK